MQPKTKAKAKALRARPVAIAGLAGACIVVDLAVKALVRAHLEPFERRLLGPLELHHFENPGLAYGLGAEWPEPARFWLFTVLVGGAAVAALGWLLASGRMPFGVRLGSALVAAGSLANVIDRVLSGGGVLDCLALRLGPFVTSLFNPADAAIGAGALALGVALVRARQVAGAGPSRPEGGA